MKKLIPIIIITAIALSLSACSESKAVPETQAGEIDEITVTTTAQTTQTLSPVTIANQTTEAITEPPVTEVSAPAISTAPKKDDTKEEFRKFIQNNEIHERGTDVENGIKTKENVLKSLLNSGYVPQNCIPGFELFSVTSRDGAHVALEYRLTDYVYDNKLDESENHARSAAIYNLYYFEGESELCPLTVSQLLEWGFKPLNLDDRVIYHRLHNSMHGFEFMRENGRRFQVWLPAIDGLSAYDMLKYLDMVKVQ